MMCNTITYTVQKRWLGIQILSFELKILNLSSNKKSPKLKLILY